MKYSDLKTPLSPGEQLPRIQIHLTMLMMASLIAFFGHRACSLNEFTCDWQGFPSVSSVMGYPLRSWIYTGMLTVFALTKYREARGFHEVIKDLLSERMTSVLMVATISGILSAPFVAFFDCYSSEALHLLFTGIFVLGEVTYLTTILYVLNVN